ncbi:MAG: FkbM family methyltransferase [Candidatus Paceibacterota bacterium]
MLLPARDIGGSVLSMYGISPHKSERRLTLWLIKNLKESDIFYDVGAHLGYYTALSEELVMDGEVHAFEANKYLCTYLEKNFLKSSCVHVSRSAVADHIGEVDFYDASDTDDSSTSSRFHLSQSSITPSKVTAITLDEYVRLGNIPPTVLKLDIEGGESDAILGALEVIKIYKPRIAMDVWGGDMGRKYSSPAVKKLQDYGYQAFALDGNGDISKESIADPVMSISDTSEGARGNFVFLI